MNRRDQGIDFPFGIIESEGSAASCRNAKEFHQRMRTMLSGTHGNAFKIEQGGEVMRVRTFDLK
jgi:hypothetical protein